MSSLSALKSQLSPTHSAAFDSHTTHQAARAPHHRNDRTHSGKVARASVLNLVSLASRLLARATGNL
eukprot:808640-Amphidinium_carterae.2